MFCYVYVYKYIQYAFIYELLYTIYYILVYFYIVLSLKNSEITVMNALFVCKCLNVTLESDNVEDKVDIAKLELTPTEQRDIFFSEVWCRG